MYYIANYSGGKDSEAMVRELIRRKYPLDEVVAFDGGWEFYCVQRNWENMRAYVESKGIKFKILRPECSFQSLMLNKVVNKGKSNEHIGYSWCGGSCRWGTTIKARILDNYAKEKNAIVYVGIAADETKRLAKNTKPHIRHPLAEWGITEAECLSIFRREGVSWVESGVDLYDILDRVSCFCCRNKNLWELYAIWKNLHFWWNELKILQALNDMPFKNGCSIFDLERKFAEGYIPKRRKKTK